MKIKDSKIVQIEKWINVNVLYKRKNIDFSFTVVDGKVIGNHNKGMSTSTLSYFQEPEELRKKHFKFLKEYVEKTFN